MASWISADGRAALARDGDTALVLWRRGDGYVARDLDWAAVLTAPSLRGRRILKTADGRPSLAVADDVWPPKELAA